MAELTTFDVVILGAGPAGSAAAKVACDLGLRVAILDKSVFPREKLCGGLFTGRSEKALDRIFGCTVTPDLFLTTNHMRFTSGETVLADIPNAPPVHLTMRRDLDAMLVEHAINAGAAPYFGISVSDIDLPASVIMLSSGETLNYGVLIGADGANSLTARTLFGAAFDPDTIGFGLEVEVPLAPQQDSNKPVTVDFNAAEWGYGWSFPKHATTTVGVGGIHARNGNMKARMTSYVTQMGACTDIKYKGQYLPFGDFRKNPGYGNVLLAGDAAGLVDPITGEGIALAMESGAFAAQAAQTALSQEAAHTALRHYKKLLKPTHSEIRRARIWRLAMFHDASKPHFQRAFAKADALQMKYLRLLAGEASYLDLRAELLARLPKLTWRIFKHRLKRRNQA